MKRVFSLILALMLLLSGCGGQKPLPEDWDASWTVVSDRLAAEPLEGFELKEINTALAVSGIYYATWASGEAREHVNEEGEEAQIFDAQVYVLSQDFRNAEAARKEASGWTERAGTIYQVGEPEILTLNGQEFTLLPLLSGSETNPYTQGYAAWAIREDTAVWVELLSTDNWDGDLRTTLVNFLSGFHYN